MERTEPTVYRRTLARAIEVAGSDEKLARFLRLPLADLQKWSRGEADLPSQVFLALVDIVASNSLTPAALGNLNKK
jgi:DNA-binding transcriptional regulator YiaG